MRRKEVSKNKSSTSKPSQFNSKSNKLRELNKHNNFDREGKKGNSRKWDTLITCVMCKKRVILPFKPRDPEVYCDDCFKKINKKV